MNRHIESIKFRFFYQRIQSEFARLNNFRTKKIQKVFRIQRGVRLRKSFRDHKKIKKKIYCIEDLSFRLPYGEKLRFTLLLVSIENETCSDTRVIRPQNYRFCSVLVLSSVIIRCRTPDDQMII